MIPHGKKEFLFFAIIVLLAFPALLSGCGNDDQAAGNGGAEAPSRDDIAASARIDACDIVTQTDASALFGMQAVKEEGAAVLDPGMIGECLWGWDSETAGQLLQFRIWNGAQYYSAPADSTPFTLGDESYIRVNSIAGVDIEWVQDGKTISLSYFTTGTGVPEAESKVEEVKKLAAKASAEL